MHFDYEPVNEPDYENEPAEPPAGPRYGLFLAVLIILLLLATPVLAVWITHNNLAGKEEAVDAAWAQVESTAQRRADLIPNLVKTVQRYLDHERSTLSTLTAQRMSALVQNLNDDHQALQKIGTHDAAAQIALQKRLQLGTRNLLALTENYPDLRSADQFLSLQAQLEGTENRLNIARMRYNEAVRDYNSAIRGFLATSLGLSDGMTARPYFESEAGTQKAPDLDFD